MLRFYIALVTAFFLGGTAFMALHLTHSHQAANESYAVANLRTVNEAEVKYKAMSSSGHRYGTLTDLIDAGLFDKTWAGLTKEAGTKSGYTFAITVDEAGQDYIATAVPMSPKVARYAYSIGPDAVVHYSTDSNLAPYWQAGKPVGKRR